MALMPQKCMMHITPPWAKVEDASASIKSSSDSLRQRGLSGIAEDASEFPVRETDMKSADTSQEDTTGTSTFQAHPERTDSFSDSRAPSTLPSPEPKAAGSPPPKSINVDKALPPTPGDNSEDRGTTRSALEDTFLDTRSSIEGRRPSIQSNRPSIKTTRNSYEYRPKVKMGPRPSLDSSGRRRSNDKATDFRPISTLPNGVRLPSKKQMLGRPKSASGRAPIPEMPEAPLSSPQVVSQATVPDTLVPSLHPMAKQIQSAESKSSTMTPEKRRLRKALELRQKQLAARNATQNDEKNGQSQGLMPTSSGNHSKRDSLTATLPDISPGDDSGTDVLQERVDTLREDPGIVHVGPQDVGKDIPENFEVSPISILEASDGPSTQASSISDEDETPTMPEPKHDKGFRDDNVEDIAMETPTTLDHISLPLPERSEIGKLYSGAETAETVESQDQDIITLGYSEQQAIGPEGSTATPSAHEGKSDFFKDNLVSEDTFTGRSSSFGDSISPLCIRRSSSAKSINTNAEVTMPHEIPLPPIDEDEEISLTPQRKAFIERSASRIQADGGGNQNQDATQAQGETKGSIEVRPSSSDTSIEQREKRARRQGLINPIKRISSPDYSDEQFLSDDSFMEELTSATVQEAKPISVSKSPIMPIFPRSVPESKSNEQLRPSSASSNRLHRSKRQDDHQPMMPKLPDLFSARSSSAPYTPLSEAQLSPPTLKKVGVSSGISQRIKALEQLSTRPSSPSSQLSSPSAAPGSSPVLPKPRKSSFRASQAAKEIAKASTKASTSQPPLPSPSPPLRSPDQNSSKQLADNVVRVDRIDVTTKDGKTRPESISVTARIIRGSQNKVPRVKDGPSRSEPMDLYSNHLTAENQSARPTSPLSPLNPPKPLYSRSISSTSSAQKSDPLPAPRRNSITNRLSSTLSRRGSEPELPHSISDTSLNSLTNFDGSKEENRKESRKSRLFKRMSNISAASRRSIASALSPVRKDIKEEPIVEHHEPSRETIKPVFSSVEIGDVNVQFPDTLLWKRRHLCIDEKGLLVLSASKADNKNSKVVTKRYPFTEFNPPYLPDQEMQELPN
ncbi:hypothetical protein Q9189_007608, partial [Teloschistes chrysophthalmus]